MVSQSHLPETFGAEMEKTLPRDVTPRVFRHLAASGQARGTFETLHGGEMPGAPSVVGCLTSDLGEQGLDNNRSLLETSLPVTDNLLDLARRLELDLETTSAALAQEGLGVVNLSLNPLLERSPHRLRSSLTPRWLYAACAARGLDLCAALDAPSQNSPNTGVALEDAARGLSVIEGAGAAVIAIFANSPFAEGSVSGWKASRLSLWRRYFAHSAVAGDQEIWRFPRSPYRTLASYFRRMFGGATGIRYVSRQAGGGATLKSSGRPLVVSGWPSVFAYLSGAAWEARPVTASGAVRPESVRVVPEARDLERNQSALFSAARFRFRLRQHDHLCPREFVHRCRRGVESVEEYLAPFIDSCWLEGRDPCANYPDPRLTELGPEFTRSMLASPSAIQAGLLRNAPDAWRFLSRFPWKVLGELRIESARHGLAGAASGTRVRDFAARVLELAAQGLRPEELPLLRYPEHVLRSGKNGADRALDLYHRHRDLSRTVRDLTLS